MSKKAILSALLISSALLGTTATHAATSDIKSESKKVTVCTDKAKLYKDSKLKESTTPKNGTVYQVNGYRDINGKHVYRVYQTDKNGKQVYRGYIDSKDTKDFNGQKASGQFVLKGNVNVWKNFYWTEKNTNTAERVVFAKYEYTLGNGQKYYSVYTKDAAGKDVWQGYTTKSNLKEVTSTKESKYITLKKNTKSFANLYFQQTKGSFDASKGVNFKVTRYYTIDGKKYYSTEQAKEAWTGYVDSSVVEDLKANKVAEKDQKVQVVKAWNTYSNHFFSKKGQLSKDKIFTMKYTYTYGNGKKYASLYDGDTWLGYANIDAVKSANAVLDNANEAITDAKEHLKGNTADSQKAINDAIKAVEDAIKSNDVTKINDSVNKLNDAVKNAQPSATSADMERLNEAIQVAQKYVGSADTTTDKKALDQAIADAKKVQEAAKENNASSSDVDNAIKAIEDAINNIKPGETSVNKEEIQKLQAAIDLLEQINKIGADKLENDGNYDTVLQGAQDVLKLAKDGKATQQQIDDAVKSVEDFINGLRLNNSDLEKLVNDIKESASKVYLTKDQEDQINQFVQEAEEAVKDTQLSNVDKLKTINENAEKAKNFIAGQPTENDVKDLMDAIKQEQNIEEKANGKESEVFDGWDNVTAKDKAADTMLENIKKDDKDGANTATQEYTAQQVQTVAGELKQAIDALTVNQENTTKFYNAAAASINELDGANKSEAQTLLDKFKAQLQSDHSINNIDAIVAAAKALAADIEKDQKQELDDAIAKAKRIEGSDQQYKKYYTSGTYDEMNNKLTAAETADAKLDGELPSKVAAEEVPAEVTNGQAAEKAEKALESAIDALKVQDWNTTEEGDSIQLTKYTGNYKTLSKSTSQTIEVPAMLKDKQVVLKDNGSSPYTLFGQQTSQGNGEVKVQFVQQDGKKVDAGDTLYTAFGSNYHFGDIDLTNLDTSKVQNFTSAFINDKYLTSLEGEENLVTSAATNLAQMFFNAQNYDKVGSQKITVTDATSDKITGIDKIDVSNWDTSNVTSMLGVFARTGNLDTIKGLENLDVSKVTNFNSMFRGTTSLTDINLSGWVMNPAATTDNMFANYKNSNESQKQESGLTSITLPNDKASAKKVYDELCKESEASQLGAASQKITIKYGDQTGTLTNGQSKATGNAITTDEATLKDASKLSRAILESSKSNDASKELAEVVDAAYKVDKNSTGDDAKSIAGLENNRAWTEFGGQGNGSYYDAIKDLQDYARNTTSVKDNQLAQAKDELIDDMEGLRVTPTELEEAMDAAEKATSKTKSSESTEDLIEQAEVIVNSKTDSRRGLDNWKNINNLIAKLKASIKK